MSFDLQNMIALSVVGVALAYLVRQLVRSWRKSDPSSCGSSCGGGCHANVAERLPLVPLSITPPAQRSNGPSSNSASLS